MKKFFICIFLFLLIPFAVFATDYQYLYTEKVLYLDLSQTSNSSISEKTKQIYGSLENKICDAGYYSGVAQSSETQITVSCNYTDANGNFIMVSDSSNGLSYRHFSLGVNYIVNMSNENLPLNPVKRDSGYYKKNSNSFYKLVSNTGGGFKIPYGMPLSNSAKVGSNSNNTSTPWAFLVEFVIIMDDASEDLDHLTVANDYQAVLTFTMNYNKADYVYQISVRGYYGVESQSSTTDGCNLIISDYNSVLPLNEMLTNWNSSTKYEVGHIFFETLPDTVDTTKKTIDSVIDDYNTKWKINVKPYPSTQTEFEFISIKDNTVRFPVKVFIDGDTISVGNATKNALTVDNTDIYTTSSTNYMDLTTSSAGTIYPLCVSSNIFVTGTNHDHLTQIYHVYEGSICIETDTSRTDMTQETLNKSMKSGEYYCNIQFEVTYE